MSSITISCLRTIIHVTFSFGTNCPKLFPSNMARVVYPPSPHIVQNSRELSVKGASAPPFIGGLPLTGGTGCSIPRRCDGGISSRAAPFSMIGKGRGGLGWTSLEVYLWSLPTVPMSAWWKRSRIKKHPPRRRPRKEPLVQGVLIGKGLPVFSAIGNTSKSRADVWTFSPKKRPVCKGFPPRFMMG